MNFNDVVGYTVVAITNIVQYVQLLTISSNLLLTIVCPPVSKKQQTKLSINSDNIVTLRHKMIANHMLLLTTHVHRYCILSINEIHYNDVMCYIMCLLTNALPVHIFCIY